MNIKCEKCQAGPVALNPHIRALENGQRLQVVRCILCGWQVSRPEPHVYRRRVDTSSQAAKFPKRTCTRHGCNETYAITGRTKYNLCRYCQKKLRSWIYYGSKGTPPFVLIGDIWYPTSQKHGGAA